MAIVPHSLMPNVLQAKHTSDGKMVDLTAMLSEVIGTIPN